MSTKQFYDPDANIFLNGRQVQGRCPILNCPSEKAYADECSLGHQYMPNELLNPRSTLTGKTPEMRDVTNWFVDMPRFRPLIKKWTELIENGTKSRKLYIKNIDEFLEPPIIHVKRDQLDELNTITLPPHQIQEGKTKALRMVFEDLEERERAVTIMADNGIRFRTGKTLVPFRLTGNIDWGLPVPTIEDLSDLTWWVWPESLIAPISFTAAHLEAVESQETWQDWWCSPDCEIFQFIGEDNVYFYGVAEIAMFLGMQDRDIAKVTAIPAKDQLQLPQLIVNNHLLFLDKKASSSSEVKPPLAKELLEYYTSDQLRAHFFALGLGIKSVSFKPKPLNPQSPEKEGDPVLKEGNLLTNVFNRVLRSCFYTAQKYTDGTIPLGEVSEDALQLATSAVLKFERSMYRQESHLAMACLDKYIREISKFWTHKSKDADLQNQGTLWDQLLRDSFHMVRVATVLMHPIAPNGCEIVRQYFRMDEKNFWRWEHILKPITELITPHHKLQHLEPRTDFFNKHKSQLNFSK